MHQRSCLERVLRTLLAHVAHGQLSQLVVHERQQFHGLRFASRSLIQQASNCYAATVVRNVRDRTHCFGEVYVPDPRSGRMRAHNPEVEVRIPPRYSELRCTLQCTALSLYCAELPVHQSPRFRLGPRFLELFLQLEIADPDARTKGALAQRSCYPTIRRIDRSICATFGGLTMWSLKPASRLFRKSSSMP
jgi:hypothetical protein